MAKVTVNRQSCAVNGCTKLITAEARKRGDRVTFRTHRLCFRCSKVAAGYAIQYLKGEIEQDLAKQYFSQMGGAMREVLESWSVVKSLPAKYDINREVVDVFMVRWVSRLIFACARNGKDVSYDGTPMIKDCSTKDCRFKAVNDIKFSPHIGQDGVKVIKRSTCHECSKRTLSDFRSYVRGEYEDSESATKDVIASIGNDVAILDSRKAEDVVLDWADECAKSAETPGEIVLPETFLSVVGRERWNRWRRAMDRRQQSSAKGDESAASVLFADLELQLSKKEGESVDTPEIEPETEPETEASSDEETPSALLLDTVSGTEEGGVATKAAKRTKPKTKGKTKGKAKPKAKGKGKKSKARKTAKKK